MSETRTEIASLGEFGLIHHLTESFINGHHSTIKGIGDDAAVIAYQSEKATLLSTDLLLEGVHFDLMYCPLKHLGYKAVVVNLSDIYAMNGTPKQITVSIGISNRFSVEALDDFYDGIKAACKAYNIDLIGGDTTTSLKGFIISITVIGEADKNKVAFRNGAKENDLIFITGDLGAAYIGLQLLEREKQMFADDPTITPNLSGHEYTVGRQLKPEAQKDCIEKLAELNIVPSSMIDISDGLSSELFHICTQSSVGCLIYEEQIPIDADTYETALKFNLDPITCAVNGGEDYELLFTVNRDDAQKLYGLFGMKCIGQITHKDKGIILESKAGKHHELKAQGWNLTDAL